MGGSPDPGRLVGRDEELAEICCLMGTCRLVTVTGVGGVGKSRLAAQVATQMTRVLRDGTQVVDLSAVADAALVDYAVATALGIADQTDRPMPEALRDYLGDREFLLVLDNCEHLLEACATLVVT